VSHDAALQKPAGAADEPSMTLFSRGPAVSAPALELPPPHLDPARVQRLTHAEHRESDPEAVIAAGALGRSVVDAIATVVAGRRDVADLAAACLLSRGHLLIEDIPGVGKTLLAQVIARIGRRQLPTHPGHRRPPAR
jgi:hypothetical protein